MDWERNRRFDDHRGGESYRPGTSRGFARRSRSPRNRSPRLVADTWVPSSGRPYGRLRSRSPPTFRRRSRSPPFSTRDPPSGPYSKTHSPRRFSPRRDGRPRSPPQLSWRSRSPYPESRSRDYSRGRNTTNRPRDLSPPNQDFRSSRRERPPMSPGDHYRRSNSHSRRAILREDSSRSSGPRRSRSPLQQARQERYTDKFGVSRRRSPSPRALPSSYTSAPGSMSNSRRSSPFVDRVSTSSYDHKGRSPIPQTEPRRMSKHLENNQVYPERSPSTKLRMDQDEARQVSPAAGQYMSAGPRASDSDNCVPSRLSAQEGKGLARFNGAAPVPIPSRPRASGLPRGQSPPSGPSYGSKPLAFHNRGSNLSLLSAPTRPRGGPNLKDNSWGGAVARRGPNSGHSSLNSHAPPTGPRISHMPTGPSTERQHSYRQGNNAGITCTRTPKYMNHLAGLTAVVPGGRFLPSTFDGTQEKRLMQLESDKDRLLDQISDYQKQKRVGIRDWDKLDRESSICALKSELAEGHLQRISDGEGMQAAAIF